MIWNVKNSNIQIFTIWRIWNTDNFQLGLMLLVNHVAQAMGFIFSPCRLASIRVEKTFDDTCLAIAIVRLFTFLAAFSWKLMDHICIHFLVTKVGNLNFRIIQIWHECFNSSWTYTFMFLNSSFRNSMSSSSTWKNITD